MVKQNNVIKEKSFSFALNIIDLYRKMKKDGEYVISKQLLRSGTSIGANIEESTATQSRKDFINKLSIASKESRETKYWLQLLDKSDHFNYNLSQYIFNIDEIVRILSSIVKTLTSKN